MNAFLHQQDLFYFQAHEEVAGEGEDFDEPFLAELIVAGFGEDKERQGGDKVAEEVDVINIDIKLGILFASVVHEKHRDEQEVNEDQESVNVFVIVDDPDEEDAQVAHAEVDEPSETADERSQMEGILELQILVAQLDLLEEQEDHAVDEDSHLVM